MNYEARALSALIENKDMKSALQENPASLFVSHKNIWEWVYDYYRQNKETPPATVVQEVFPTFVYSSGIEGSTKHHLARLREKRLEHDLREMLADFNEALSNNIAPPSQLAVQLSQFLTETQRNTGVSRTIDVRDIDAANEEYNRRRELAELHGGQIGIASGFEQIDRNYSTGFAPGHFCVGLGYSGLGKTWFIIQLAINAWKQGYKPMIINLEMTPEELRDRVYFLISNYSMDDLVKAEVTEAEFTKWAKDYMADKVEFVLIAKEGFAPFTTDMVAGKIEQHKPDIVYCDYLQLFWDRNVTLNDVQRARAVAREFKEVATATGVPVVVISAVTGKDKKDRLVAPSLAQVAWSSEIEYAANFAFAVRTIKDPETRKARETQIICLKNRHGEEFSFDVKMDLDKGTIEAIPEEDQMQWADAKDDKLLALAKQ